MTEQHIQQTTDYNRPRPSNQSTPTPRNIERNDPMDDMVNELLTRGFIEPSDAQPTGNLFLVPKNEEKSRAIFDLRPFNHSQPYLPKHFSLPNFNDIKHLIRNKPQNKKIFFTKLDVSNFYWSIVLPNQLRHKFVFQYNNNNYAYTRLPFGWDFSPAIAQRIINNIKGLRHVRIFIYLDDVLIAGYNYQRCKEATITIANRLTNAGLPLNNKKCQFEPSTEIIWLSKKITQDSISNDEKLDITCIAHTLIPINTKTTTTSRRHSRMANHP
eukprot:GEZU01027674.1.p1 GENE.GEZU01027674.1~~GEZU01027674.1.p1  ORF type:complete len:270 (-),score=49.63 GEZU01027674.1:70-879(-)